MSTLKRLTGNFAYSVGGHFIESCVSLFLLAIIARYLQPERFGIFAFAMAFVQMFYFLADIGLVRLLVREIARYREQAARYLGAALISRVLLLLIVAPVLVVTINLVSSSPEAITAVYMLTLWITLRLFSTVYGGLFQAFERMEFDSGLTVLNMLLRLGFTALAIRHDAGLPGVLYAMVGAQLICLVGALVIAEWKFTRPQFKREPKLWKLLLLQSLPIGASGFFNTAYHQVDTLILSAFRTPMEVGLYNGPYRIIRQVLFLPLLFLRAPFPIISRLHKRSPDSLAAVSEQLIKFSLFFGLPIGVILALLDDRIILLVLGPQFLRGVFVLQFYSGIVILMFPAMVAAALLVAMDRQGLVALILAGSVLLNTLLDLLLIPSHGGIGACLATLIATFAMLVALIVYVYKYLRSISLWRVILEPILATAVLGCFFYTFQEIGLPTILITGSMLYAVVTMLLLRFFSREDLRVMRETLRRT